jgi:hypothetical protein
MIAAFSTIAVVGAAVGVVGGLYQELALDDQLSERAGPSLRPSLIAGRSDLAYYPGTIGIPESSSPEKPVATEF